MSPNALPEACSPPGLDLNLEIKRRADASPLQGRFAANRANVRLAPDAGRKLRRVGSDCDASDRAGPQVELAAISGGCGSSRCSPGGFHLG